MRKSRGKFRWEDYKPSLGGWVGIIFGYFFASVLIGALEIFYTHTFVASRVLADGWCILIVIILATEFFALGKDH